MVYVSDEGLVYEIEEYVYDDSNDQSYKEEYLEKINEITILDSNSTPKHENSKQSGKTGGYKIVRDVAGKYSCECGRTYSSEASLRFHKYECGKEPSYKCPYCSYRGKRNTTRIKHIIAKHKSDVTNLK